MNNLSNDDPTQQTTADLFDPFAPTTTTTMFDDVFVDKKDADVKEFGMRPNFLPSNSPSTQPLSNYNFDDLWNQSMSHIDSSNNDIDPNTFAWDAFLNTNENTNPFNDNSTIPTWENLFGEKENDLKDFLNWIISKLDNPEHVDFQPAITFTSTQNLESVIKDIQMCAMPFDPIPSPPLHVDHTVTNAMINAMHHELFPIDELEQPNISQGQPSMILYEEDEEEEDNELLSFDDKVQPVVEKLVSDALQIALTQLDPPYDQVEHFVDQILAQAIFEVNKEDEDIPELETNDIISTGNLTSIIAWHDQTNKQLLDPFDKKFDSVWSSHFQAPDNTINENKNDTDPWLTTTTTTKVNNNDGDAMLFSSHNLDDSDLFSSTSNPTTNIQEMEDDESGTLSEYVQPALLTSPGNSTAAANNMMKYTLTAPVIDDSGDDSSTIEDYFAPRKNEPPTIPNVKIDAEPIKPTDFTSTQENEQENVFSSQAHLSQFEAFASDQPLNSPEIESKFTDDNTAWTSIEKPSNDVEPWELEDSNDEKLTPVPTTTRLTEAFDSHKNYFSDSFKPNDDDYLPKHQSHDESEQTLTKTVRFDDNVQNIIVPTLSKDELDEVQSSSTSDSDEVKVDDITPSFDAITDRMETSYVSVDEIDVQTEHSYESVKLNDIRSENEDLPSPPPPPLNDRTNISNDNIPLKSSHLDTQYKINLPSETEITTTTTTDTRLPSDTQLVRPFESAILRSTSRDDTGVDPNEKDNVISCVIDNTTVNIDAKTISPFKCVISSAGTLQEDNQTAVIAIYGCWLPDHRLREYRYIMDQLFYYVYHKLEELVTNDYVLIYFHGATPKHRTPDLKFLRKCYQMINFRLRKNLRSVYVVHPTRWLRTVIALSRPFFSNKFYHKINYLYTIAELERQFPHNRLSIPVAIEQYEQTYRVQ